VDTLLFVRASGQVLTGGKKTFGWVVGGQKSDMARIDIGAVNAQTGAGLYFAKPVMDDTSVLTDVADIRAGLEASLRKLVLGDATAEPPARRD
jgi:hypothetical protein